jgi:hypothetical protein
MSFRRGQLDVYIPVLAIVACIAMPLGLSDAIETVRGIDIAKPKAGHVTSVNDRPPYADKKDRFSLEYPMIEYVDHEGFTRHLTPHSGAFPGYFHIGQEVKVGMIGGQYVILDRWYVWQEHFVLVPFFGLWICLAIGYYLYWRPRMIAKEKQEESNQITTAQRASRVAD